MKNFTAALLVLIGATLFGFIGLNSRTLGDAGFSSEQVTMFRILVTLVIFGVLMCIFDRGSFRIRKEYIAVFILLGFSKAFLDYTFILSQEMIPLSLAAVLQMTAPFFVMVLVSVLFKDKMTSRGIIAVALCILGAVLVSDSITDINKINVWGVPVGVLSGVLLAVYIVCTKYLLDKGNSTNSVMFYAFLIGFIFILPVSDIVGAFEIVVADNSTLVGILGIGIMCTLIPFYLDTLGTKYLKPLSVSVLKTSEVISSAVVGLMFFGEPITLINMVGVVLVILSIVVLGMAKAGKEDTIHQPHDSFPIVRDSMICASRTTERNNDNHR